MFVPSYSTMLYICLHKVVHTGHCTYHSYVLDLITMILIHSPRQVKDITYHLIHISIHMFFWAHFTVAAMCAHLHSNRSQCAATALYIMVSSGWLYKLQCWEGGGLTGESVLAGKFLRSTWILVPCAQSLGQALFDLNPGEISLMASWWDFPTRHLPRVPSHPDST